MQLQSIQETEKRFNIDEYLTVEASNMISLSNLCKEISISLATGRNWVKLGKLIPSMEIKGIPYFTYDYIKQIKSEIQSEGNTVLKSRRNKKYISGSNIYNSYVSKEAINLSVVQSVMDTIGKNNITISNDILLALLADCAIQMVLSRTGERGGADSLKKYFLGEYHDNPFIFLVDDLLNKSTFGIEQLSKHPELFQFQYIYEEKEDILGLLYISLKNIGSRKAAGIYYTPTTIVKRLCERLFLTHSTTDKTVLDPCCGTGNFLLQLPDFIDYGKVFGNDIDEISVKIARINYALKYMIFNKNIIYNHITIRDYLSFADTEKFDIIVGNPPWGYVYLEQEKEVLRSRYLSATGSNIESYDIFIEQALRNLSKNGVLSFVLPEAILNVKLHKQIRTLILKENSFGYLEFLGDTFDGVQCPCIILQIIHTGFPFDVRGMVVNDGNREFTIESKRTISADCLSFNMSDMEYLLLHKIESIENKATLCGRAIFALGIVTGNNKKYILKEKLADNEKVLKGSDLRKYRICDTDNYIVFRPELFQQIAPVEYYRMDEKLLYRFICNQLVFAYDNQKTLSLNSCNVLIPQISGLDIKYILAVLNSRIAQFYFWKRFHSVKVLRSHIEQIPIPVVGTKEQERIIQMVNSIMDASDDITAELYDEIDREIAILFEMDEAEYQVIKTSLNGENLFL